MSSLKNLGVPAFKKGSNLSFNKYKISAFMA
jgi:hypothetical protein